MINKFGHGTKLSGGEVTAGATRERIATGGCEEYMTLEPALPKRRRRGR